MATNLAIDDHLLKEALAIGGKSTKKATVTEALMEYIARRQRMKALEAFGTLPIDEKFDFKRDRKKR